MEELFKEQLDNLLELVKTGTKYEDANLRIWKMKEMIVGPKVGPAEPACINNPITGELITNKEIIKSTNKTIREGDQDELDKKVETTKK